MPVTLTCARCGQNFTMPPSLANRKYCSRVCFRSEQAEQTAWTTHNCLHCGNAFRVTGKEHKAGRSYCSRPCHHAATARQARTCGQCGTEFYPKNTNNPAGTLRGQFCSKTCSGLAQRTRVTRTCIECRTEFEIKPSRVEKGRGWYCSKACMHRSDGTEERTCQGCGKRFRAVLSVIAQGWGSFCSQPCTSRRVTRACQVCGSEFSVKQSVSDKGAGLYCSNPCRDQGKLNQVPKTCPQCGVEFSVPASLKDSRRACSRSCWSKMMGTDPRRSAILARARHEMLTNRAPTRPERILYGLIDELMAELAPDIGWERQLRLLDRWTVDAAIPALHLVLQADGDYWHGLHPEDRKDPRVLGNMANDGRQDRKLTAAGWTVLRFWERDLIRHLSACAERLRAAVVERTMR
ncbi:endonuclease domain-containing protein [Streptomyces griseocarneus]|uniref:endonuclease domain-containing protein n=1 Tax=Streptomyces griseocarneus TaxID=51201 RepID=UPI00167CD725|nr:DUF559 domain-containing protein [Streptomyces griseocarneus]MBZ6476714.1 very short patch repair endonuclease [Streptomyces griseocarneus]GHG80498.1 hypothetical protein GCM10018779_62110 [Streptomyces griseocarneus]